MMFIYVLPLNEMSQRTGRYKMDCKCSPNPTNSTGLFRGDLYQSWERGQEVFEELLLDADWSLNAGNWMWLSASSFSQYLSSI